MKIRILASLLLMLTSLTDLAQVRTIDIAKTTDATEPTSYGLFTLTMTNGTSPQVCNFRFTVSVDATSGAAAAAGRGADYENFTSSADPGQFVVSLGSGETTTTIDVNVFDDLVIEPLETVTVRCGDLYI